MRRLSIAFSVLLAVSAWCAAEDTTLEDRTDVAITAYNNGIALVRDTRQLDLPTGEVQLTFQDVAEKIRPETVSLQSVSKPGSVGIYEQNYEYDLISPEKLMEKYVGRDVRLVNFSEELGFTDVPATLMSNNQGPVYRVGGDIYLGHPGYVVLPEIPGNLIAKPSLIWTIENGEASQELQVTYLTNGIRWQADYVVTVPRDESSLDLDGWVTMNNQSGATYTNAQLKLVAGDVNLAPRPVVPQMTGDAVMFEMAMDMAMPAEEAFAEYHLYTMPRRTTIKQNQSKQLALLKGTGVNFRKHYEYRGQVHFYYQAMPPMEGEHVEVFLKFQNEEENKLGIPLPGGVMRVYQEDSGGALQFAGEDRIQHTPKDEEVTLRIGKAFDIIADRVQTDFKQVLANIHECAFEITVRNHKEADVVVDVIEPMPKDWEVLESSQEYEKKDAHTAVFRVPAEADGEAKVTYRVRVKL